MDEQNSKTEKEEKKTVMVQKHIRAHLVRMRLKNMAKKFIRRKKIFQELIETQQNYIRDLGFIHSDFKMRLLSSEILTPDQCNSIFANVNEIRKLHEDFFTILYNHFVEYHPYRIVFADILKIILFFRIYIEYLNNFVPACNLIEELKMGNRKFEQFLREISISEKYKFLGIEDYLVKPVQRLPKYILLLKEILKNTQPCHPDYVNITKALKKFIEVNENNNNKLTEFSNSYKLIEIVQSLNLPEGTIEPGVQFVLEECVQILNLEQNFIIHNCIMYLLNNLVIVSRRFGSLQNTLSSASRRSEVSSKSRVSTVHSNRSSNSCGYNTYKQKLEVIVPIQQGTSLIVGKNMSIYKYSLTIQSVEGDTCTFICENEQDLSELEQKLRRQIERVEKDAVSKLEFMMKTDQKNESFLKNAAMLDLMPEVYMLGTTERGEKMFKYTVYIVEVKVKMVRQKIFVRFSELVELEKFVSEKYRNKFSLKQNLISCSWIKNHHQKTIEERKMNIQRFIKELLCKPEIITNGAEILQKLDLPFDFYELPKKITSNKCTDDFLKKSSFLVRSGDIEFSQILGGGRRSTMTHKKKPDYSISHFRMSIFKQSKIEEEEEEEEFENQNLDQIEEVEEIEFKKVESSNRSILKSQKNPKSSLGSQSNMISSSMKLTIQDLLKANEIDLGHYTRYSEQVVNQQKNESQVELTILIPSIENLFVGQQTQSEIHSKIHKQGYQTIKIKIKKGDRIQNLISEVAKKINLKYFKDFRLFVAREYYVRVADDDEIIYKVVAEMEKSSSHLVLKKQIYIHLDTEEREMRIDQVRLKLVSSQIINDIKKGKYKLTYIEYLKFASLAGVIFLLEERKKNGEKNRLGEGFSQSRLKMLGKEALNLIFPKYTSLSDTEQKWITDFIKTFQIIFRKLEQIKSSNRESLGQNRQLFKTYNENTECIQKAFAAYTSDIDADSEKLDYATESSMKLLAYLSIVKEIEKVDCELFGCSSYSVQISEEFQKILEEGASEKKNIMGVSEDEKMNCWLEIKYSKIFLMTIALKQKIIEISYNNLAHIETYATYILLKVKNMRFREVKLKTTSSYYIRELLVYYKNYNRVFQQICSNDDLCNSVISMSREELFNSKMEEYDEQIVL